MTTFPPVAPNTTLFDKSGNAVSVELHDGRYAMATADTKSLEQLQATFTEVIDRLDQIILLLSRR